MLSPILNLEKVRNAQESISAYDEQLNITLWNPGIEKRTGVAEKDALGKCFLDLFPYSRDDQRTKFLNIAMSADQSFFFPNMIYLYLQPFSYYTQYIQPLKKNGKIIGVINIVRDHTIEETFTPEDFTSFFDSGQMHSSASLLNDKDRAHL
jgi:PAS domain-containing protein